MSTDPRDERNVIPRWRTIAAIERSDLVSGGRFTAEVRPNTSVDFAPYLEIWRKEGDLPAGSDIFDTYLLTRDPSLLRQASRIFDANKEKIPARLRQSLISAFQPQMDPLELRKQIAFRETDEAYLTHSIRIIKRRLRDFPRDGLAYLELARLYTILGRFDHAERALRTARHLAPDDRIVLRATLRFYDTIAELEEGLKIIQKSDRLKFDPWIQSAEIASSTLLGKASKIADRRLIRFGSDGFVSRERTELAMAMATLDRQAGVKERKIFQLVGRAIPHSTENGLAQAVWLSDQSSRDFTKRFPDIEPSADALEVKVQLAVEQRDFIDAVGFAELWLEDQPFNIRAILQYLDLSSIHTKPSDTSARFASRYMQVYSDNWHILNACALVLIEAKDFEQAKVAISRLERATPDGVSRAFVEAAYGFLAFAEGNFSEGRRRYERATRIAAEGRRNDLLVDSTIFWFRCEATNGLLSEKYITDMIGIIDRAIKRVPDAHRSYLQTTWYSVKLCVESLRENLDCDITTTLKEIVVSTFDEHQLLLG